MSTLLMTAGAWLLGDIVVGVMIGRVLRAGSRACVPLEVADLRTP
jgi:hypothetical protein